jgi:hypothetical protein
MIQLRSDCLVFEVSGGDKIPCSVEKLTIEVLADSVANLDPEVIRNAAAAVLHYFRDDLGRESVTIDEFTAALEHVLRGLGFQVQGGSTNPIPLPGRVVEADLSALAVRLGDALELGFYPTLRSELRHLLAATPQVVHFTGLRECALRLANVNRWCPRSIKVSDEIVRFLRDCWGVERPKTECALLVN